MDCRRFWLHRSGRFLPHPLLHQLFWVNSHDNPRHHQVNTFKSYLTRNKCFCLFLLTLCMHACILFNIATTTLPELTKSTESHCMQTWLISSGAERSETSHSKTSIRFFCCKMLQRDLSILKSCCKMLHFLTRFWVFLPRFGA